MDSGHIKLVPVALALDGYAQSPDQHKCLSTTHRSVCGITSTRGKSGGTQQTNAESLADVSMSRPDDCKIGLVRRYLPLTGQLNIIPHYLPI